MSTKDWRSAQSGPWNFGSYWDFGPRPTAADAAVIALESSLTAAEFKFV